MALEQGLRQLAEAEALEDELHGDPLRTRVPVAALERNADSSCCHEAKEALGAALGDESREGLHELRVDLARAADQGRVEAHRVRDPAAAVETLEPGEGVGHALEGRA